MSMATTTISIRALVSSLVPSLPLLCGLAAAGGGCTDPAAARLEEDALALPGDTFHPEGLATDRDGNLYVGSVGTGEILRIGRDDTAPISFIPPGTGGLASAVGLAVDEDAHELWVCAADPAFTRPNALQGFDLATGAPLDSFLLPGGVGICNDLVRDPRGNLYVTDSITGRIHRLAARGAGLEIWSDGAALAPRARGEFTVNGAAYDAATNSLFVVKTSTGELFRVPIGADGAAGAPVAIALDRALRGPDGLQVRDGGTLFVVEDGGLARIALDGDRGTVSRVADGIEEPSGVLLEGDSAWVAEGQIGRLIGIDPSPKVLPFTLRRVAVR